MSKDYIPAAEVLALADMASEVARKTTPQKRALLTQWITEKLG